MGDNALEYDVDAYTDFVNNGIKSFREWYQPVDFGHGIVVHVQQPLDYIPRPECFDNKTQGMSKWNYIIKPNLPDVHAKRVLDVGCSSGLFSIQLALQGAKEVIGVDRTPNIARRANIYVHQRTKDFKQDVVGQANFVKKAFEMRTGKSLNVEFIGYDLKHLEKLDLGKFDLILALCVVYHEMGGMPRLLKTLSSMTDYLVLQVNLIHRNKGRIKIWSSIKTHLRVMSILGFDCQVVNGDEDYLMPLIICRRKGQKRNKYRDLFYRYIVLQGYGYVKLFHSLIAEFRYRQSMPRQKESNKARL